MSTPFIGVRYGMPAEEYFAAPGVSQSMLQHMDPPARLPVYLAEKREVTPWMRMGTFIHHLILTPELPLPKITVQPETYVDSEGVTKPWHNGAKPCKAWRADRAKEGVEVLKQDELDAIKGCDESIASHPRARELMLDGEPEVSVFYRYEDTPLKARIDWVSKAGTLVDVKKVGEGKANPDQFERLAWDRGLHMQAAFYLDLWNAIDGNRYIEDWHWIVVEDTAPYLSSVVKASEDLIERGRQTYLSRLKRYIECAKTGVWPGYNEDIRTIGVPEWVRRAGL